MFSRFTLALALSLTLLAVPGRAQDKKKADKPKGVSDKVLAKIDDALPATAPGKVTQPRKLLIFSKTNGFRHGSIATGAEAIARLGKKTGAWTATHSEDDAMFEPEKLKEFDAVLMLNTTGEIFKPRDFGKLNKEQRVEAEKREAMLKDSLVAFVKGGKGLAGTHSATDTYHRWGAYNDMMGGAFVNHPWHKPVPIKNLDPTHPVNAAFEGKGFEITDEIYQFRHDTALATDRRMLLALDADKMDVSAGKERKDGLYAIAWVGKYGNGRTFYCSLGHRDEVYFNPLILKHYLAGIQYALGDLAATAEPTAKK